MRHVPDVAELVQLVHAAPHRAATAAQARLAATDWADARERAQLHWVIGQAEREQGRLEPAKAVLQRASALAASAGDPDLSSRIHSSLAFVIARQGDLDGAHDLLVAAERQAGPLQRARLLAQRGVVAHLRGDLDGAAEMLTNATDSLKRHGDHIAEARHRANLGAVLADRGRFALAGRHLRRSITIARELGLDVVVGIASSTLGYMATLQGDLPGAIQQYTEAERRFERAGADSYLGRVNADHAKALADAGLLDDAASLLARALDMFRVQGQRTELAAGLLASAEILLASGDGDGARDAADEASTTLTAQRRWRWVTLAANLALQARARTEGPSTELISSLESTAALLESYGRWSEATRTRLVAAKLRAESTSADAATMSDDEAGILTPASRRRVQRGRPVDRILLAYVDAVAAERRGDRRAARRAVTSGLRVAVSAQAGLGAIETRAHAAAHAYELTEFGARMAIADNRPRELLARIEATRLMTSRMPMLRPPGDDEMAAMLTELRSLSVKIADMTTSSRGRAVAEQQRMRLERRVGRQSRGQRGDLGAGGRLAAELDDALGLLGDRQLLAHAVLDDRVYAVSVSGGRARLHELGPVDGIGRAIDALSFAMSRLNRTQGSAASRRAAGELFDATAIELAERLVPAVVAHSWRPVVIVPTALLHDMPWGVLPPFGRRAVTVDPSISAWARAQRSRAERQADRGASGSIGFVAGPGLEHAEREVAQLGSLYHHPRVLTGSASTVPVCLDLFARSEVVHIACHGTFRTDNPMFSALRLADGQLVVYDFERLDRLPQVVVMSACSVANSKAVQGGSFLGLAAALTTLGASSVIAPLSPISDVSSVEVMLRLHEAMLAGSSPAEALAIATSDVPDGLATAGAFVALGS